MTSAEYKKQYGSYSLASEEYRQQRSKQASGENNPNYGNKLSDKSKQRISENRKGSSPWNKGKRFQNTEIQKAAAQKREQRYLSGELERKTHNYTQEMREKVSVSVKKYAQNNQQEVKLRAQKALNTKRNMGYDLGFFRGKSHSDAAREKISAASKKANLQKTKESHKKAQKNAELANCTIKKFDANIVFLECNTCNHSFTRTRQYLTATKKFKKDVCEVCYPRQYKTSMVEFEIAEYLHNLGVNIVQNTRTVLPSKKEIDIYVPESAIGIEVNGVYWHSQLVLESNGHSAKKDYEKYLEATENNIKLITVYDLEWTEKQDIVKSRIAGFFGKNKRMGARQCELKEISSTVANNFLRKNHLQGSGRSNVRYGLFYSGKLVSVMTFSKENISRKINCWEINRFCNLLGCTVIGGASKMFNYFMKHYNPHRIISYSDNRWGDGALYTHLGMTKISNTPPNYWYFQANDTKLYHRYALRKTKSDNPSLTEWENRKLQNWNRVWDCGNTKWELVNSSLK